ncbi:MAG: hypothetical protein GQ540_06620, partial [Lutibacter sp.]|uniref:hypothetical protein n=1 Tax=Lutibacter sp. TaxID=1925666 RepID=UPI0019F4EB88
MKVFIEEQKFTQPIVIIGLLVAFIVVCFSIIQEWESITNGTIGEKITGLSGLVIILLVAFLFANLKLKTRINERGVYYQYFPFHFSLKLIEWNLISECYIRNYDAIFEYGGWGVKFSFRKKKGKSFTTKGDIGLQLELNS